MLHPFYGEANHLSSIFSTQNTLISKGSKYIFLYIRDKNSIRHSTLGENCC